MSEMVQNKGVVKELYRDEPTIDAKLAKLADDLDVSIDDIVYPKDEDDKYYEFKDSNDETYHISGDRLFDISGAPYDGDADDFREYLTKTSDDTYEVDFYYYNGGTYFGEIFDENLREADDAYEDLGPNKVFYAIKFKDGRYWARGSNASPSTFSTEGRARGTANNSSVGLDPDSYDIVKLVEQ